MYIFAFINVYKMYFGKGNLIILQSLVTCWQTSQNLLTM